MSGREHDHVETRKGRRPTPPLARFERFIDRTQTSGCWRWTGASHQHRKTTQDRHGHFRLTSSTSMYAHMAAYVLFRGPIPEGMTIEHLCGNTLCVNPDHLECVSSRVAYTVTSDGRVFSGEHNRHGWGAREVKQWPNSCGYQSVHIWFEGRFKSVTVHKLVALSFLPTRPSQAHEVRHLDGNPLNNCVANLAWGTSKDNAEDRERHGRTSRGETHKRALLVRPKALTPEARDQIVALSAQGYTQRGIAKAVGRSQAGVGLALKAAARLAQEVCCG